MSAPPENQQDEEGTGARGGRAGGEGQGGAGGTPPPTCCLGMKTPGIILRNILIPKEMWDEFPQGITLSVSDNFLYHPVTPGGVGGRSGNGTRPSVTSIAKPSWVGLPYEDVWIRTEDGIEIYAFLIKPNLATEISPLPTLIFFHGNAGSIGDRLDNAKLLYQTFPLNILMVEYRGYGPSHGTPSEKGLYLDAKAALTFVRNRKDLDSRKIFLFGRSLGGAVAINLAAASTNTNGKKKKKRGALPASPPPPPLAGLIVENTFTSVPSLARKIFNFPGLRFLPRFFYNNKYDNKAMIKKVKCPTLFITSAHDELLPEGMMLKLYKRCGTIDGEKTLRTVEAGHNDAYQTPRYAELLSDFIGCTIQKMQLNDNPPPSVVPAPVPSTSKAAIAAMEDEWSDLEEIVNMITINCERDENNNNLQQNNE